LVKTYEFDVVVVGAGPAGSSAAYAAAKQKRKVALIEKEKSVSETVRTSGVTWIEDIKKYGIPEDFYNPIKNFGFCSPNNEVIISDKEPRAAVLDVRKTFQFLASEAAKVGTEIFVNTNVNDVILNEEKKIIGIKASSSKEELIFKSKIIIDASGFQSVVGQLMKYVSQWKRFGVGAEYEAYAENVDPETWWLMVGSQYSPSGYAWIFPIGKNRIRIGVGIGKPESEIDPSERLKEIIEKKLGPIKKLGKISPIEFHYGLIPNEGLIRKTVYDNLILVGDSAGQANPLVLEGIRYAIRFGRIAGKVAARAVECGDTSEKSILAYEKYWKNAIESKIKSAIKVQNRWIGLSDEKWDKEIGIIKHLNANEFLDFIKADFGISNLLRLAAHHPQLVVRQLFRLVRGN